MEIIKKKAELPLVDLMDGCDRWEINVDGQHGFVALVDISPRLVPIGTLSTADKCDSEIMYNGAMHYFNSRKPFLHRT